MVEDTELMTAAITRGVREEVLAMARAGHSVCTARDGKVVWLTPEEVYESLGVPSPFRSQAS